MGYWDTSALIKLYVKEPDSALFEAHVLRSASAPVTSRIALFECQATFHRKEAESVLQPGSAQVLYSELLRSVTAGELRVVELGADVEREYNVVLTACVQQYPRIALRTLDALHLASARAAAETELIATDIRMREAAKKLGLTLFPA